MSIETQKLIVGSLETCDLPELGIFGLEIRVDTGAKTSSLHVDNLSKFQKDGRPWLKFDIHPDAYQTKKVITCETILHDLRRVKSSNGESEQRYVIQTTLKLGSDQWPIQITLTDRSDMSYLMLLGREGMGDRLLVDPSTTFLLSN
ncbi:RimK/LysX family protein [Arenicella sp. 4NH20-0111]|uniref:ATP-dependent zinc protease family protein n=1 Tax=Arenicella sp. 4NH20-0111 TaxID=3127648 RepID=UPI00310A7430